MDEEPVMFPRGPHQLLGWSYAMEGISSHEPSVHAKLIQMRDDGYIRPVPLVGINLKGLSQTEIHGLAAGIREKVEQAVTPELRYVIWARYADSTAYESSKMAGMAGVAGELQGALRKTKPFLADCVWYCVCTEKEHESCCIEDIAKKHGVGYGTAHRTITTIRDYLYEKEKEAAKVVKRIFANDGVL